MTFFYDLNKKLDSIRAKPETTHKQLNERDMSRAAKGHEKYGKEGMQALAKAGREGKDLDKVRDKYNKYDESVEEGLDSIVRKMGSGVKKVAKKALDVVAPGDEALLKDLQKKVGVPQTGKPPMATRKNEAAAPMSSKQKSFAALAEPKDKITFADKIAGAKKEVDEMLGDVAAEAMKSAVGATRKIAGKRYGGSLQKDDEPAKPAVSRGRGRPKKPTDTEQGADLKPDWSAFGVGKVKLPAHKGAVTRHKLSDKEPGEKTNEADDSQINAAIKMLKKAGYKVEKHEEDLEEKAVSKKQQKFMGMVHAAQKGEKPASKEVAKTAKDMGKKDAKDFASTKHKGLPEKIKNKKKEEVEETTTSGSVATSTAEPKSGGKSGMTFGKGIYDSMNYELEQMISESMNVSMNMSNDPHGGPSKSITVTASDEDAEYLGKLLKMAGLGGDQGTSSGCGCGSTPCSCGSNAEMVDENQPDWPTNTETSNDALQYSGGLNKPKSTGQTTVPVIASQEERQESYAETEEDAIKRMMEMAGIKESKKPDFLDMDKDGNKEEPMKKAIKDKEDKKVEESIFAMTNLWKEYKAK
jgi:hypothetical protein